MPLAFVSPTNGFSFSSVYNVYSFILFLLLVNKAFDYILVQKEQLRLMKHFLSNNLSLYLHKALISKDSVTVLNKLKVY